MTNEQILQAEKSLRWVVNQIPNNLGDSNEERMLKCIRLYCNAGAEMISQLSKELADLKRNKEKNNETNDISSR